MNSIFIDKQTDLKFKADGFVVIPFAETEQLEKLRKVFQTYCSSPVPQAGLFYSLLDNDFNGNFRIAKQVKEILASSYERVFANYKTVAESFLAKPRTDDIMLLHQDWNYTDEKNYLTATIWCPLENIMQNNGSLFVLKGSHHFFKTFRSGSLPTVRIDAQNGLHKHLTVIEVNRGEAVIFHPALFHGSGPNFTDKLRVIACSIVLEKYAPMVYYQKENETTVNTYAISQDILFDEIETLSTGARLRNGNRLDKFQFTQPEITSTHLLEKCKNESAELNFESPR